MDVHFSCPTCDHHMLIDERAIGLVIVCLKCGQHVIVPKPLLAESEPQAEPEPDAKPAASSGVKDEKTVALKWTPPTASPRIEPKK